MTTVDRSSPTPLYKQLKQILLRQIQQHDWQAGELIPSENALEEIYGISRVTVRQALAELVHDGYLLRQRGRGTFVKQAKFMHDPARRLALNDMMQEQGVTPGWQVLESAWLSADDYVAGKLGLAGNEVMGYHRTYIVEPVGARLGPANFELGDSLGYLRQVSDLHGSRSERTLEALSADKNLAKKLAVEVGSPLLHIERVTLSREDEALEFMRASYRGDRFKYHISL